jgi:hypothetical protein
MTQSAGNSILGRRDRTGGIVRDKLDLLMHQVATEEVPARLIESAQDLQSALNEKFPKKG